MNLVLQVLLKQIELISKYAVLHLSSLSEARLSILAMECNATSSIAQG